MAIKNQKIISLNDVVVKFNVRGKTLKAIRNVSFDIYDGETVAIVGESGSGKSVLTKTLTNMLESNGYISNGSVMYYPTEATKNDSASAIREDIDLVNYHMGSLSNDTRRKIKKTNLKLITDANIRIEALKAKLFAIESQIALEQVKTTKKLAEDMELLAEFNQTMPTLISKTKEKIDDLGKQLTDKNPKTRIILDKIKVEQDIIDRAYFELATFSRLRKRTIVRLRPIIIEIKNKHEDIKSIKKRIVKQGLKILAEQEYLTQFELVLKSVLTKLKNNEVVNRNEISTLLEGWKFQINSTWKNKRIAIKKLKQIRGGTIATIFQDPMTSLNPLLSVGYQITEAVLLHNKMSRHKAKQEALDLMQKVGITNPEKRFHDIPGKYSGGMRQRIVIAIALACKPKVLICDEPTTALDVTIQAQILDLIKQLKKEFNLTVIFITHDLGVVANVADRVAVLYAGQVIEYGTVKDIFFDARHPYTWALLSSLPQLGTKGEELFAITGTPPSLFSNIIGDAFAPRNEFALAIDFQYNPPMFEVSKTHGARTWLLDPRAPKIAKPKVLEGLKEAIKEAKVGD